MILRYIICKTWRTYGQASLSAALGHQQLLVMWQKQCGSIFHINSDKCSKAGLMTRHSEGGTDVKHFYCISQINNNQLSLLCRFNWFNEYTFSTQQQMWSDSDTNYFPHHRNHPIQTPSPLSNPGLHRLPAAPPDRAWQQCSLFIRQS